MELPPSIPPSVPLPIPPPIPVSDTTTGFTVAYWRRVVCFTLLVGYPLMLSVVSQTLEDSGFKAAKGAKLLPEDLAGLLVAAGENLLVFGIWFLVAAFIGRLRPTQLQAFPPPRPSSILWGLGWSVALRMVIAVMALIGIVIWMLSHGIQDLDPEFIRNIRPKVENLVAPESLRSPWYLFTNLTVISFVLAGFREELWRAGMIASGLALLPGTWRGRKGQILLVIASSVVFGLAHLPQGWGGVALTGILGLGFGSILIFQRSLWIAVLAHGDFNATTFLVLWALDHFGKWAKVLNG